MNAYFNGLKQIKNKSLILRRTLQQSNCLMDVLHDKDKQKFYINLEKGQALLDYSIEGKSTIDMYHTGVPTAYRGHGIAKYLVQEALKYATDNSLAIKPTCSYVLKYINDHPDPSYKIV